MAIFNKPYLDKQYFLEQSNSGLEFYQWVIEDLKMVDDYRCENVTSPFYDDTNPSFSIYLKDDVWRYHDHGDPSYSGDVFSFAALYFKLDVKKDFWKILNRMYQVLRIELPTHEKTIEVDDSVYDAGYFIPGSRYDAADVDRAYEYYMQFGITKEVLLQFGVRAISSYYFIDKNEELKQWNFKKDELVIAYEDICHAKLYIPGATKFRFKFLGSRPSDFVFGQKRIIRDMIRTKNWERELLIIAAGEKDVMTLTSLGYDAICLNSETATVIPEQLESSILNNYKWIIVLYDLDETGNEAAAKLQRKHLFKICTLPGELKNKGGKDVSDYVRLGMDKDELRQIILTAAAKKVVEIKTGKRDTCYQGYKNSKGELINQRGAMINKSVEEADDSGEKPIEGDPEDSNDKKSNKPEAAENITAQAGTVKSEDTNVIATEISTPLLPDDIFKRLPSLLKSICSQFTDPRERDVVFLSSLVLVSTLLPTVKSVNSKKIVGANLFLFITAPAASGKGVADWGRHSGKLYRSI